MDLFSAIGRTKAECFAEGELDAAKAMNCKGIDEVRVLVHKIQTNMEDLSEHETAKDMVAKVKLVYDDGLKLLTTIGETLTENAASMLTQVADELKDISGGIAGGKDWLQNVSEADKGNYKKLSKRAAETLSKEPRVATMKSKIDAVARACQCEHHCVCVYMLVCLCVRWERLP